MLTAAPRKNERFDRRSQTASAYFRSGNMLGLKDREYSRHQYQTPPRISRIFISQHQSLNIELCDEIMYLTPPRKVFAKLRALAGYPREDLADSEQVADRRIHARDRAYPMGLNFTWFLVCHGPDRLDIAPSGCDS